MTPETATSILLPHGAAIVSSLADAVAPIFMI